MTFAYKMHNASMASRKPPSPARSRTAAQRAQISDHRVRTGEVRREQTRRKLLNAALRVFAEKGVQSPPIDDFIVMAGVARGTFYNYFTTPQELLEAVTAELSNEVVRAIENVVVDIEDPLERFSCGVLIYMHLATDLPNWGAFIVRTGLRGPALGLQVDTYLPRDLQLAREQGLIDAGSQRVARDFVLGSIHQAIESVLAGVVPREHLRAVWALTLRGLGVPQRRVAQLCAVQLPEVTLPEMLVTD